MPITPPTIDDRRFRDFVRDALARVPVHTPEWTQLGESDPGVTLVELFAFLTESLLYRANRAPEVSRLKFLQLLGLPLAAASPARGLVVFRSTRSEPHAETLPSGTEVRAGEIAFRTNRAIDVLPIESQAFIKARVTASETERNYYELLYAAAQIDTQGSDLTMYQTRALDPGTPPDLANDTVDGVLWIALLAPDGSQRDRVRSQLAGRILSLGLTPYLDDLPRTLAPVGQGSAATAQEDAPPLIRFELPAVDAGLTTASGAAIASYRTLSARSNDDVLAGPGLVEISLPAEAQLDTWREFDPLEEGVGEAPPEIGDTALAERIVTWLRVVPAPSARARFQWAGVNAVTVDQRVAVLNELLGSGDGRTDQEFKLARSGVVPRSVRVDVYQGEQENPTHWSEIDDLMAAGSEVRAQDARRAPGQVWQDERPSDVFLLDAEAHSIRFGDGMRGRRPAAQARLIAHYEVCEGARGNVPAHTITTGPALPPGIKVDNPWPTWGGADAESVSSGEKRVSSFIRHRDRLVAADDFAEIARRTPGIEIARVEVLSAYHPDLGESEPGDAPGVVTLMVVPRNDPRRPDAPSPDRAFLDALCRHLDPRRLVTTELVLRGPDYVPIWLSLGITIVGGFSGPEVRDRVKRRIEEYLAPARDPERADDGLVSALSYPGMEAGWPLRKAVNRLELIAEASREPGVLRVNELRLASGSSGEVEQEVALRGLQLPRIAGLSVELGNALALSDLRGGRPVTPDGRRIVPVPTVPEAC